MYKGGAKKERGTKVREPKGRTERKEAKKKKNKSDRKEGERKSE